jgi:two-component system heavy metal sensor histidine kinase CusS
VIRAPGGASLAARLVLLFVLGSAAIMAAAGYALYHALRMELEAADLAEVTGKTEVVEHLLGEFDGLAALEAHLQRLRDVPVGHPNLRIGALAGGRWLLPLEEPGLAAAGERRDAAADPYVAVEETGRSWLLHRVHHVWSDASAVDVVVATETTGTRVLLRDHALIAALVAFVGTAASALLALFVVRRGLAPLAQVAARAGEVTAQRLGARLDLGDAPREVHGLAESINRMLERLEQSFVALEQFSADIAHELRTPLNNLLLETQVTLGRPRTAEEYRETLHSNLEELERLQRMVSEMLFLARADRGMIELALQDVDLREEAASVADYFEAAASERGQRIEVSGQATVRCDRSLARRAVTNLLSNAVRYAPPSARIEVALARDGSGATVAVSNPAAGIAGEELERLFGRFARRDESRARGPEGAGLGLAIVDSIMKLQGGSVEASCRDGSITFRLRFPAAADPHDPVRIS